MRSKNERILILLMRISVAWIFLFAASHQVLNPGFTVTSFLATATTFKGLLSIFAAPAIAPEITFLVAWGHLLIGLSLLLGVATRVGAGFGTLLMVLYWMAHLDFPYLDNHRYFLVDYHVIFALILVHQIIVDGGHVYGMDALVSKWSWISHNKVLSWATA